MDHITKIEKDIRNSDWPHGTISRCKQLVATSLMSGNERQSKVGSLILEYIGRELTFVNEGESQNTSSDLVESILGVAKNRMSDDKLSGVIPIILMMPLRLNLTDKDRRANFNFEERLEEGRHHHIKEWTNENLSPDLVVKHISTIGKKYARFQSDFEHPTVRGP